MQRHAASGAAAGSKLPPHTSVAISNSGRPDSPPACTRPSTERDREAGDQRPAVWQRHSWAGSEGGMPPARCACAGPSAAQGCLQFRAACMAWHQPAAHLLPQWVLRDGPRPRDGGVADDEAVHPLLQRHRRDVCSRQGSQAQGARSGQRHVLLALPVELIQGRA